MFQIILSAVVVLTSSLVLASAKNIKRMPSSENVKTLICVTGDMSPNIDIRIEFAKDTALVKLIDFGNDVDQAPTDGWGVEVSAKDAQDLIKGNAALAFYDKKAMKLTPGGKLLALKNGNGFVALPFAKSNAVYPVNGCKVH